MRTLRSLAPTTRYRTDRPLTIIAIIFIASYAALAVGRVPGLRIDRTGVAIVGAILMVVTGAIDFDGAVHAVDARTLVLLFSMMILVAHLRLVGAPRAAAHLVNARGIIQPRSWLLLAHAPSPEHARRLSHSRRVAAKVDGCRRVGARGFPRWVRHGAGCSCGRRHTARDAPRTTNEGVRRDRLASADVVRGGVANLIVVEGARRRGVQITFAEYAVIGVPLSIAVGVWWLSLRLY